MLSAALRLLIPGLMFQELNIPHDVKYPSITPKELICGFLSQGVHNFAGKTVYVSSDMDPALKKFYAAVVAIDDGRIREYCEAAAAVGKQLTNL